MALFAVRPLLDRLIDNPFDFRDVERLADVVERAGADRFDRRLQRAEPADQDDGFALVAPEPPQEIDPGPPRVEVDIRDQQIERLVADSRQRRVGFLNRDELPVRTFEQLFEKPARVRIVVDQQDARHG